VTLDGRPVRRHAETSAVAVTALVPVVYAGLPSSRVLVRLPEARNPIKSVPRKVRPIGVSRSIIPIHRPVSCVSVERPIKSIPREVACVRVGSIESIPREVPRIRIGSIKSVPWVVCCVSARAAASVAEPVETGETVGRGPTGVAEIRPPPTKPLSLSRSRSSRRNCKTHA
jgi:hypothetical protein